MNLLTKKRTLKKNTLNRRHAYPIALDANCNKRYKSVHNVIAGCIQEVGNGIPGYTQLPRVSRLIRLSIHLAGIYPGDTI